MPAAALWADDAALLDVVRLAVLGSIHRLATCKAESFSLFRDGAGFASVPRIRREQGTSIALLNRSYRCDPPLVDPGVGRLPAAVANSPPAEDTDCGSTRPSRCRAAAACFLWVGCGRWSRSSLAAVCWRMLGRHGSGTWGARRRAGSNAEGNSLVNSTSLNPPLSLPSHDGERTNPLIGSRCERSAGASGGTVAGCPRPRDRAGAASPFRAPDRQPVGLGR